MLLPMLPQRPLPVAAEVEGLVLEGAHLPPARRPPRVVPLLGGAVHGRARVAAIGQTTDTTSGKPRYSPRLYVVFTIGRHDTGFGRFAAQRENAAGETH